MAKIIMLVFALLLASNANAFTFKDNIEGYNIVLNCNNGTCKGTASKFIFTESFNAQYEILGNNAIISIDDKVVASLNLNLKTGNYTYDWKKP